jgi:hypothetical protein
MKALHAEGWNGDMFTSILEDKIKITSMSEGSSSLTQQHPSGQ